MSHHRIAVIGGGPGGLYFAALAKQLDPAREITVWERNAPDDTFGFGVVFSDETLGGIEHADPVIYEAMRAEFARWDDIDVHCPRGEVITSGGHGFAAMGRVRLLQLLRERCLDLGVTLHHRTEAPPVDELAAGHDLVVAADGLNSTTRTKYADTYRPSFETRRCKYIWLGTDKVFDAFTFAVRETPYGVMQLHAYPYDAAGSTLIVEMHDEVWRRAGFSAPELAPGESDQEALTRCADIFTDLLVDEPPDRASTTDHTATTGSTAAGAGAGASGALGDEAGTGGALGGGVSPGGAVGTGALRTDDSGRRPYRLLGNNSRWINFTTVRCETWRHGNVVLLGDAAHTAHFSIGSGTKLAMEDALALAACLSEQPALDAALEAYETERRPVVLSTQRAAQASLEWFENLGQYTDQPAEQFAFNILTRSRRVTYDNLRLRDPEFVARIDRWYAHHEVSRGATPGPPAARPPMFHPFRLRERSLKNRIVVSPMDMYCSADGVPTDFHLVHLGSKALGDAGLVMTEMVCVSPEGRITPGCGGLWTDEQQAAWRRIAEFVHGHTDAKIGMQLGHSGRKGSTKLTWEGIDEPLPAGNWEVVAPSPIPYSPVNQVPRELTLADLAEIREQFTASARRADAAGFDLLELHCAHGYLLSSFLSPLTNHRTDAYGGALTHRLRFPLEVFDSLRQVWPAEKPLSVRISATDWHPGGIEADDAVAIARAFADHGVDLVDVSTGQVVSEERPAYGRSYQTPYADRIRQAVPEIAVIAVGAISSYDDVNSILLAGRADLCALGRTHLYDPQWTLHAAAEQDYPVDWPVQFAAGSRRPAVGRTDGPKPRLELIRTPDPGTRHERWRP